MMIDSTNLNMPLLGRDNTDEPIPNSSLAEEQPPRMGNEVPVLIHQELLELIKYENMAEEIRAREIEFEKKVAELVSSFLKHLEAGNQFLLGGSIGSVVISLSSKIGCYEFCWVMGILMLMMVTTIYDAYEVTSVYEGLKIDGKILDHQKSGLTKKISHFRNHVLILNKNRIPPPKVVEYEFLPIGFTIRNLPSLEERFHALERESDMSKLLMSKKNYMLMVLARSIIIAGVVGVVGYGFFCEFG